MFSKVFVRIKEIGSAFSKELIRKSIHLSIAIVPLIASYSVAIAIFLLMSGLLIYLLAENARLAGQKVPFITDLTEFASRKRDEGHLVMGPVTLALGALFVLFLFPLEIARLAILVLAFADGFSSVIGKIFGRITIPFTGGKTLAGSLTAFTAILLIMLNQGLSLPMVFLVAAVGTTLEALPLEDLDNVVLPVGTGFLLLALM